MATTIGALRVELSANIAKFEAAMGKAAKNMARTQRSFAKFGSQATAAGRSLSIGLTAPLVGIGVGALRSSVAFESAFAGVIKTVDDATDGMGRLTPVGESLQQGFRDLSLQIPIAVTELASIGEVAGQLGIESEHILGFTEVMAKLGVTTNLSAEEAATSLAQLANITSLPQTEFERLGSTVVALGNNLATNEAQIVNFGQRIASAGNLAGLTEPQILAIGGAMASVGVEAEAGGTAVQKVLNAMTLAVVEGGDALDVFARTSGQSAAEFERAFREDAAGAFSAFVAGLGQQGDSALTTLKDLGLGNERVIRSFLSLASKSTTLTDALAIGATAWEENTALAREADIRFQTTASQLKLLANQVVEAGRALGDILKPILQTVVGIVRDQVVPWLKTVVDRFKALSPEVQTSRILWLGFAAALGPALIAIGGVARALTPLVPLFSRIWTDPGRMSNALVKALFHPIAAVQALRARLVTLRTSLAGLSLSARASAVGVKLATVAMKGLRFAIRGVIATTGPFIAVFAAFEFAQWAAGALNLGDKLKRLVGITDDAVDAARDADAAYEGLNDTLAQTEVAAAMRGLEQAQTNMATATRALNDLERERAALAARLGTAAGHQGRQARARIRAMDDEIVAQQQVVEAANARVEAAQREVKAEQAAARASTNYTEALAEARKEVAGITEETGAKIRASQELGVSLEELSQNFGLSTEALRIYLRSLDTQPVTEFGEAVEDLGRQQRASRNAFGVMAMKAEFARMQLAGFVNTMKAVSQRMPDLIPPPNALQFDMAGIKANTLAGAHQLQAIWLETMATIGQKTPEGLIPPPSSSAWSRLGEQFVGFGQQIGQTFVRALEGGGQWLGAMQSLGVQAGDRLGTFLSKGLTTKMTEATGFLSKGLGKVLGQAAGMAIPLIGPVIGSLVGKLFSLGGPSEAELAGRKVAGAFRDGVIQTLDGGQLAEAALGAWRGNEQGAQFLIGVRDAYLAVGRSAGEAEAMVTRLWRAEARGPAAVQAVQRELQVVLDQAADLTARNRMIVQGLESIRDAGPAAFDPVQLDPYLAQMEALGLVTADEAAALRQMADDAHVDWRAMESAAEKYGVQVGALGPAFEQAKISDAANQIVADFALLTQEGANVNGVLRGMQDEVQELVTQALTAGVAIPAGMQPILASLIEQGALTDENGQKLTDLSGLTFAAPIAEGFDLLADKIQLLIITLGGPSGLSKAVEDMAASARLDIKGLAGEWAGMTDAMQTEFGSFAAFVEDQALRDLTAEAGLNYDAIAARWKDMTDVQKAAFGSFREFLRDHELTQLATDAGRTFDDLEQQWTDMTDAQRTETESFRAFVNRELDKIEDKTVTVTTQYRTEGAPAAGDGATTYGGAQHGTPFRHFGAGTPMILHGLERVMTAGEGRGIHAALGRITGGLAAIADLSGVRALAEGGLVTRPTLATFAEHGPEVAIPLERLDEFGGGRRVEAKLDQLHQDFALLIDEFRHGLDPRRRERAAVAAAALSTA